MAGLGPGQRLRMLTDLETLFPRLRGAAWRITSPVAPGYNCIAWAAGDPLRWWWPELDVEQGYWPIAAPHELTLAAFEAAFGTLGYEAADQHDWEEGWEKIALFALLDGGPTHAARQLPTGRWTSKIGKLEDIEHELHDLEGAEYGSVVRIMKRPAR